MKPTGVTYLIFTTQGVGGAEKRLVGLWLYLKSRVDMILKIVCTPELFKNLSKQEELKQLLQYREDIIYLHFTRNYLKDSSMIKKFIIDEVTIGDCLHFVGFFPYHINQVKGVKYYYSLTTTSLKNVNLKGRFSYLMSVLRSSKADILDPQLHKFLSKLFFFKKNILRTSSSFVDTDTFFPEYPKKNWIVYLGRFVQRKQVLRFVRTIPKIWSMLQKEEVQDICFYILGYGALEKDIMEQIALEEYADIPIVVQQVSNPIEILKHSKIILSLNQVNNYPSKSLLEGMAAGNVPLVTDTGTTELIAPRQFASYIPKDFGADEIASAVLAVFLLDQKDFYVRSNKAREFVQDSFSMAKMSKYYLDFYTNTKR